MESNGADARYEISWCDGYEPKSSQQQMKRTERQGEGKYQLSITELCRLVLLSAHSDKEGTAGSD